MSKLKALGIVIAASNILMATQISARSGPDLISLKPDTSVATQKDSSMWLEFSGILLLPALSEKPGQEKSRR